MIISSNSGQELTSLRFEGKGLANEAEMVTVHTEPPDSAPKCRKEFYTGVHDEFWFGDWSHL